MRIDAHPMRIGRCIRMANPNPNVPWVQKFKSNFSFVPEPNLGSRNPKHRGIECFGKDLRMTERLSGIEIKWLIEAYNNYPEKDKFFSPGFSLLAGTESLEQQIKNNWSEKEIRKSWKSGLKKFKKLRKRYLIYP